MDYSKWIIKKYNHWQVQLHCEYYQHCIGSLVIWANRKDDVDIIDMSQEERDEFFIIAKQLKNALDALFQPDRYNYTAMGNTAPHLHVHMIPRYKDPRMFEGVEFVDDKYGWIPNEKPQKEYSQEVLLRVKDAIAQKL